MQNQINSQITNINIQNRMLLLFSKESNMKIITMKIYIVFVLTL